TTPAHLSPLPAFPTRRSSDLLYGFAQPWGSSSRSPRPTRSPSRDRVGLLVDREWTERGARRLTGACSSPSSAIAKPASTLDLAGQRSRAGTPTSEIQPRPTPRSIASSTTLTRRG